MVRKNRYGNTFKNDVLKNVILNCFQRRIRLIGVTGNEFEGTLFRMRNSLQIVILISLYL